MKKMEWIKHRAEALERKLINSYVDQLIVNSDALKQYFGGNTIVNYYSSPFENIEAQNIADRPIALLYLGHFSLEKGGVEMLDFQQKYDLDFYIFGGIDNAELKERIEKSKKIKHIERIPAEQLIQKLRLVLNNYYLFGFSIIHDANESYAVQNANKDIDYLSLGIPLIGNHRKTTEEIIMSGCGVFIEDAKSIKSFDITEKQKYVDLAKAYYDNKFSNKQFKLNLAKAFEKL